MKKSKRNIRKRKRETRKKRENKWFHGGTKTLEQELESEVFSDDYAIDYFGTNTYGDILGLQESARFGHLYHSPSLSVNDLKFLKLYEIRAKGTHNPNYKFKNTKYGSFLEYCLNDLETRMKKILPKYKHKLLFEEFNSIIFKNFTSALLTNVGNNPVVQEFGFTGSNNLHYPLKLYTNYNFSIEFHQFHYYKDVHDDRHPYGVRIPPNSIAYAFKILFNDERESPSIYLNNGEQNIYYMKIDGDDDIMEDGPIFKQLAPILKTAKPYLAPELLYDYLQHCPDDKKQEFLMKMNMYINGTTHLEPANKKEHLVEKLGEELATVMNKQTEVTPDQMSIIIEDLKNLIHQRQDNLENTQYQIESQIDNANSTIKQDLKQIIQMLNASSQR